VVDGPAPYPLIYGSSSSAAADAAADPLQPPRLDRWPTTSVTRTTECVSISNCKCTAAAAATGGAAWLGMRKRRKWCRWRQGRTIHAGNLANIRIR